MKTSTSVNSAPSGDAVDPVPRSGALLVLRLTRAVGALALLVVGGVHLEQYTVAHFSVVPTIGPLFLVNFIAATLLGLILLVPLGRNARPVRLVFDSLVALGGIGVSLGAFVALLVSEHTPLFGFMEHGYRLEIVIALAAEVVAMLSLGVFVVCAARRRERLCDGGGANPTVLRRPGAPGALEA